MSHVAPGSSLPFVQKAYTMALGLIPSLLHRASRSPNRVIAFRDYCTRLYGCVARQWSYRAAAAATPEPMGATILGSRY